MPKLLDEAEDDGGEDTAAGEIIARLTLSDRDTPSLTVEGGTRPLTLN